MNDHSPLIPYAFRCQGICKSYPQAKSGFFAKPQKLEILHGIDLTLQQGEVLGLVGESGSGKSTLARLLAHIDPLEDGHLELNGQDVAWMSENALKAAHKYVQMIFQDPAGALNPRHPIETILCEPLVIHGIGTAKSRQALAGERLKDVGLRPSDLSRFPHEFSGGQRQRIAIARALMLSPKLLIADEPVSALDVSVQSHILNLLMDMKRRFDLSMVFISHDLSVIHHVADRVAVMYLGHLVEIAPRDDFFAHPAHPYSRALLASLPAKIPKKAKSAHPLKGEPASPSNPPSGCAFHPRCPKAQAICQSHVPPLQPLHAEAAIHICACHFPELKSPAAEESA